MDDLSEKYQKPQLYFDTAFPLGPTSILDGMPQSVQDY